MVTGGARGCGMAFAQGLGEAGASIALLDMIEPVIPTSELSAQYGVTVRFYKTDVTSLESLRSAFDSVKTDFNNQLDILVACAGVNKNVEFLDTTEQDFDRLFSVNARGVFFSAQLAAKAMIENGTKVGSIVLVASIASHMAIRSQRSSAYCGTKGAVKSMVPGIAAEMNKYGIRVNSISPGYVKTVRDTPAVPDHSRWEKLTWTQEMTAPFPDLIESWKDEIMNGRVAEPDDIKGCCVFLAGDASR